METFKDKYTNFFFFFFFFFLLVITNKIKKVIGVFLQNVQKQGSKSKIVSQK